MPAAAEPVLFNEKYKMLNVPTPNAFGAQC